MSCYGLNLEKQRIHSDDDIDFIKCGTVKRDHKMVKYLMYATVFCTNNIRWL